MTISILQALFFQSVIRKASKVGAEAVKDFGYNNQREKCIEECDELISALMHQRSKEFGKIELHPSTGEEIKTEIIDEIADVWFTTLQIAQELGIEKVVDRLEFKVNRLEQRMKDGT